MDTGVATVPLRQVTFRYQQHIPALGIKVTKHGALRNRYCSCTGAMMRDVCTSNLEHLYIVSIANSKRHKFFMAMLMFRYLMEFYRLISNVTCTNRFTKVYGCKITNIP